MYRKNRFVPLMNSILAAVFLLLTETIQNLEVIISANTGAEKNSPLVLAISGLVLIVLLWSISRLSLFIYEKLFFERFGLGGSKRGTYVYLALQKMRNDEQLPNEITPNVDEVVRILGVFYIDDKPEKTTIEYAEAYYWDGLGKFERRGSWSSHHVKKDDPNRIELIYEIKVDRNAQGKTNSDVSKWRGALEMNRQLVGSNQDAVVLGIEAWRGDSEGKNFESAFYCERLTRHSFLSAEDVHAMILGKRLSSKFSSKLPL